VRHVKFTTAKKRKGGKKEKDGKAPSLAAKS
jgi:hypothetical protein